MKRLFYVMLLAIGLMACDSNKTNGVAPDEDGNTYVGITLNFADRPSGIRALPEDYHPNGVWEGRDEIKTLTVFLVNETAKTINHTSFALNNFEGIAKDPTDQIMKLKPTLAVKATPGEKVKAYVVINDFSNKLTDKLKGATYNQFEGLFSDAVDAVANDVAKMGDAQGKEVVLMTNDEIPMATEVKPGISKEEAIAGADNHMTVKVSRVVSRGIVTMKEGLLNSSLDVKDANGEIASKITITEIKYSIGASNKKFFPIAKKKMDWITPNPVYSYVTGSVQDWKSNAKEFDFSNVLNYTELESLNDYKDVVKVLDNEKGSRFVLPVTHKYAEGTINNYKKGNTTYFEIRCLFKPEMIDGEEYTGEPKTVFLGANDGKFYSTRELAQENGQSAVQYQNGVMKYVLWLNPDKEYGGKEKIEISPVVRNQIYHAHISSFNGIGVPSNPLNPGEDPTNPSDPDDPNDPENPDNPIKPDDPLQVKETYITATIQVLNWGIHSYEINLGSDIY